MSLVLIWDEEVMLDACFVVNEDHPLSLGYRVAFVTRSEHVAERFRVTQTQWERVWSDADRLYAGAHATWDGLRMSALVINAEQDGVPVSRERFIQIVVHEVSHLVDEILERANIKCVDTELRAYYNDWIVGKVLALMSRSTVAKCEV